jgi:pimeloyl-ACP methyl ester carboxylesterase
VRITTDDGVGLEVEVAGTGPGLMLVHGFGGAKEDFADHVPELARDHAVVVFDHRGHGASDKPDNLDAYSLDRLVADTIAVADALGLERFRLLGHSMGGMVARRVVLQHPARVEALVLMDTSPGPIEGFDPELLEFGVLTGLNEGKDALKALLDATATLNTPAYERVLAERPGYREFQDRKWADLSVMMWAAIAREIGAQSDDLPQLGSIACPALVMVGEQDKPFLAPSRAMARAIPGARLVVFADAGHSPQFENPDAWIATMREFLAVCVTTP